MNRMLGAACVVGLVGVGAVLVGAGQNGANPTAPAGPVQPAPKGSIYGVRQSTVERSLSVPKGSYTLLVFTNNTGVVINAVLSGASGKGELAFKVGANSTMAFPLGAPTVIGPNAEVKYAVSGVPERSNELTGWGAADGALVGFGDTSGGGPKTRGPATNGNSNR